MLAAQQTPEYRAKQLAGTRTPESRAKRSTIMNERYRNPEERTKQSISSKKHRGTPEARSKHSEKMKLYYQNNPDARAIISAATKAGWERRRRRRPN
jgi:hypothetical protein